MATVKVTKYAISKLGLEIPNAAAAICRFLICENRLPLVHSTVLHSIGQHQHVYEFYNNIAASHFGLFIYTGKNKVRQENTVE